MPSEAANTSTGASALRLGEWQPIETAPKDGTEIWLYRPDAGGFLGRWIAPDDFMNELELNQALLDGDDERSEPDWFHAGFLYGGRVTDGAPTHWMPLPAPPEETAQASAKHEAAPPTISEEAVEAAIYEMLNYDFLGSTREGKKSIMRKVLSAALKVMGK